MKKMCKQPTGERPSVTLLENMKIISRQNRAVADSKPTWEVIAQNIRLNNPMEHSPSSEAKSSLANREIPRLLWNAKFLYHIHNSSPLVPVLSEVNPFHAATLFLKDPL